MDPGATDVGGRTFLITGATAGIGFVTARELGRRGAALVLAVRPGAKSDAAVAELRRLVPGVSIETIALDLGDLASVRACAAELLRRDRPLHVLVNNAGLAGRHGLTRDGFELAFGVNHLGPFLLTNLLLPRLRASAPSRIVTVASRAHRRVGAIDFEALRRPTRTLTGVREYATSKLCNILMTRALARRLDGTGVLTCSLHPGRVATEIWRGLPRPVGWLLKRSMLSPEVGAQTTLFCATAPDASLRHGAYYEPEGEAEPTAAARDDALAARLWAESQSWTAGDAPPA